jgi:hypothetical protein
MKRKGAAGFAAGTRIPPAANEEFTGTVNGLDRVERPRSGWDPYEVWRTRVKASETIKTDREQDPLR